MGVITPILLAIVAVLGTASGFLFLPKEGEIVSKIPQNKLFDIKISFW